MSDTITALAAMPALHNTMGALLVGTIVSTALWGITCMQTFEYYSTYRRHDTPGFKLMVLATFVLDTLHEIFICHTIYIYLVVDFANPMQLGVVEWSIVAEVIPSAFVAFTAQTFFTYRVWILSRKNLYLTVPLVFLVVGQLAVSLVYFSRAWSVKVYANSYIVKELSQAMNAVGAVGDICITLSLIWLLHSSKSGMRRSDAMMNSLILFSLNTGLLTSICAFMSLIMILKFPDTFLYIAFFFNLSRFYSNSLLATLNARKTLKSASDKSYIAAVDGDHLSSSSVRVQRIPAHSHSHGHASATTPHHVINIVTHTETHTDKDIEAIGEYEMEQRDEPK